MVDGASHIKYNGTTNDIWDVRNAQELRKNNYNTRYILLKSTKSAIFRFFFN